MNLFEKNNFSLFSGKREYQRFSVKRHLSLGILILGIALGAISPALGANIVINLVAVNGSEDVKQYPVNYVLPKELEPEDVVTAGNLKMDYDIDKGSYYLHGDIELQSKKSKTLKIEVKDVWRISPEEIEILKKQIGDNVQLLAGTEYETAANLIKADMEQKLDYIMAQQTTYSENIERRIEEYRSYREVFDSIRKNAFSAEYFQSTYEPEAKDGTITFVIEVKNPSEKDEKEVQQKHFLPAEVKSEHVLDTQNFEVRYDEKKKQSFLAKEETFKPGETKRYQIVLRDIWHIEPGAVEDLRHRSERIFEEIKGSDYEANATFLFNNVADRLDKIMASKANKADMSNYIGTFRTNTQRYKSAESDVEKLEKMLAFIKAKKLQKLESSSVKNILQKLQSLRGIAAISKAIFGKRPSANTTWKIIWGIMIFMAFFTAVHFFTWWRRSKTMGEEEVKSGDKITEIKSAQEVSVEEIKKA